MGKLGWGLTVAGAAVVPLALLGRAADVKDAQRSPGVEVVTATRRDVGTAVKATGVVQPMIGGGGEGGSRVSGVVGRRHVRVGGGVEKGSLRAQLDARELMARRDQAAASLASAEAALAYARADLARKRELGTAKLIAPSELDVAERACAVAEQQRKEAEANLESARAQ